MDHHTQEPFAPADGAASDASRTTIADDATMPGTEQAPSWHGAVHDARTVPLTEFSLTRDQVAEMYAAAGLKIEARTVSRYAKEGVLRAKKVEAERGLQRYLYDKASVEADIAKRKQGPGSVYAFAGGEVGDNDATVPGTDAASSQHGAKTVPGGQAPSGDRLRALELENAHLKGQLSMREQQHQEDLELLERVRTENGQLRIGYGEFKGRAEELQKRLALLEAPRKRAPEADAPETMPQAASAPAAPPEPSKRGFWRRITGS